MACAIKGVIRPTAEKLILAGVTDGKSLLAADPKAVVKGTGITEQKIRDFQTSFKKKKDLIQL